MKTLLLILVLIFGVSEVMAQRPQKTKHNKELRRTLKSHARKSHKQKVSVHHVTTGEKIGFGVLLLAVIVVTRID